MISYTEKPTNHQTMPVNSSMSRRNFLRLAAHSVPALITSTAAGSLLTACTHKKLFNPDEDILISGGSYEHYNETRNALIMVNLNQREKRVIDCDFIPHGIYIDPHNKYRLLCFEKHGTHACIINIKTRLVEASLTSSEGRLFSGHAGFSKDGKQFYCVEYDQHNRQGFISSLDLHDHSIVGSLPTLGLMPATCQALDNDILVINNTGTSDDGFHQPSLVFINMKTGKLVKRIKLDNTRLNAALFNIGSPQSFIISGPVAGTTNTHAGFSIVDDESVNTIAPPDDKAGALTGQPSSYALQPDTQQVAVTHADANCISFWSLPDRALVKVMGIEQPGSIALSIDRKNYIISYGKTPSMIRLNAQSLTPLAESYVQPTFMHGSYMINWSARLREIMPGNIYG